MHPITTFPSSTATPDHRAVLNAQGIPDDAAVPERVASLIDEGFEIFSSQVKATGMRAEVSIEEFGAIYDGDGRNASQTQLEGIFLDAHRLALFAVTVGEAVCGEIRRLFEEGDPALGYTLDTIASAGAEKLVDAMAHDYQKSVLHSDPTLSAVRVLPYSPGYCGWHVSGQKKLFKVLEPERIGISLTDSCLMQPSKSVSGVLVAADKEVHDFDIDFAFCTDCTDQDCRERIQSVFFDSRGGQ
jgi:hypothetical protein